MCEQEDLEKLYALEQILLSYNDSSSKVYELEVDLQRLNEKKLKDIKDFDSENKYNYIENMVGPKPEKPKKISVIIPPLYFSKKKEFEKRQEEYTKNYYEAEHDYYIKYSEQRDELIKAEQEKIRKQKDLLKEELESQKLILSNYQEDLKLVDIVGDDFKDIDKVKILIGYYENKRVESIKEAVNLYYEEEHRKRLEDYAKEQLKLTKEAKEYAQQAADSAEAAKKNAKEAISKVESAISNIKDAYNLAEEASNKASKTSNSIEELSSKIWDLSYDIDQLKDNTY